MCGAMWSCRVKYARCCRPVVKITPLTCARAPCPVSATSWLTFASLDPSPPTVHCKAASRPTRARSRLKCQVCVVPVLDVHEPELRPPADDHLDRPGVHRLRVAAGRARPSRGRRSPRPLLPGRSACGPCRPAPSPASPTRLNSGASTLTPLGTYSSVPPVQNAACKAESASSDGETACVSKNLSTSSGCSFTARFRSTNTAPPSFAGSGRRVTDAVDLLDPGRVVRRSASTRPARAPPSPRRLRTRAGGGAKASSLNAADVGPPPFLVARRRPGLRPEDLERLSAALAEPGRLVAAFQEALEAPPR